jgi:hypothetical protein
LVEAQWFEYAGVDKYAGVTKTAAFFSGPTVLWHQFNTRYLCAVLAAAGRMPVSLLYMPRAVHGGKGNVGMYSTMGSGGRQFSLDDAFGGYVDEALLLLESRLHRPPTHACQVRACTPAR